VLPEAERNYLLDRVRQRDEASWPQIKAGVEQGFKDYQDRGFCMSAGEWQGDVHAVGVPVRGLDGEQVMAFNCGGPAFLLPHARLEEDLGPKLVQLVRRIDTILGRG
jgi:DNA-binding IclR family transcriptional regulator